MSALATVDHLPAARPEPQTTTPSELLRYAMEQKADPAYLRELLMLQREWESDQARKDFVQAMAAFKAQPIRIQKDKLVSYTKKDNSITEYMHATIGNVVGMIVAAMSPFGLTHRWLTEQKDGRVTVTCEIRHARGHAETTTLTASPDDSGGKNSIQAIASTVTYLQRYTLLAATGLATNDQEDMDGALPTEEPPPLHMADEYLDWRNKVDGCATEEDFAKVWAEMSPATRGVMHLYVKQRKSEKRSDLG